MIKVKQSVRVVSLQYCETVVYKQMLIWRLFGLICCNLYINSRFINAIKTKEESSS